MNVDIYYIVVDIYIVVDMNVVHCSRYECISIREGELIYITSGNLISTTL